MALKVLAAVLILALGALTVIYIFSGPPAVQRTEALHTVLESGPERSLIYVPESAVAAVLREQYGRGFSCRMLGVRINAGASLGFYWSCTKRKSEEEPPMADAETPGP